MGGLAMNHMTFCRNLLNFVHRITFQELILLPFALKDRAREWLNCIGKTFTTWQEVQMSFLQKYFSYGRTHALRKAIRDFTQGNEIFGEAWERFMILTRKCPHHGIPDHELAQISY